MNTDIKQKDKLDTLYQDYWEFNTQMLIKENSPLAIAAILMTQALSIYKTVMDPEEYDQMVDSISDRRNKVQQLNLDFGVLH